MPGPQAAAADCTVYGIRNCDTMKRARAWLDAHSKCYAFHDYQLVGIEPARLAAWCRQLGWQRLLNRAGTTFRKLDPAAREDLDQERAIALMLAQPSMIKRPVLQRGDALLLGFDPAAYVQFFRE